MTITGVLIVRDEADCLRQCLDSFQDVVDDIVVVDTGSKDNTVDIARAYTSKVFSHPWQDDFAEARNAASAHATGDFILQIDADECADEPSGAREKLDAFVARHGENVIGTVLIRSTVWTGGEPQEAVDPVYRFFKRGAFVYEGAIHEQVVPLDGHKREAPTGVTFLHTGYSRDPQEAVEKYARNRRILERELAKNPDHEYLLYQLGKTYYATQDFAEAIGFFERSLKAIRFEGPQVTNLRGTVMAPEVATNLLASLSYAYIHEGRIDAALDLLQAHEKIQHSGTEAADFYYVLGYAYLMKGDVPRSRTAYLASLGKGPDSECVLGTGSYATITWACSTKRNANWKRPSKNTCKPYD